MAAPMDREQIQQQIRALSRWRERLFDWEYSLDIALFGHEHGCSAYHEAALRALTEKISRGLPTRRQESMVPHPLLTGDHDVPLPPVDVLTQAKREIEVAYENIEAAHDALRELLRDPVEDDPD